MKYINAIYIILIRDIYKTYAVQEFYYGKLIKHM